MSYRHLMKVHVLIPCIDNGVYATYLNEALRYWLPSAASVTVVTAERDHVTRGVAHDHKCRVVLTDAWWDKGAYFNKGGAMNRAIEQMPWSDWILFADADVIPPHNWLAIIEEFDPEPGVLYGARRVMDDGRLKDEGNEIAGFFMLFHSSDPVAQRRPLLIETTTAGGYDSEFCFRWHPSKRIKLPLIVRHNGPDGVNWCGADRTDAMNDVRSERKRRGGWRHEVIG